MGKNKTVINGPRIIDIDIILFDNLIYSHQFLKIPHQAAHLRDFVLKPLIDIDPYLMHPMIKKPFSQILEQLADKDRSIIRII